MYDLTWFASLFPHFTAAVVMAVDPTPDCLALQVRAATADATCPRCGTKSARVHGRYERTLRDTPMAGRCARVQVHIRRFKCVDPRCPAVTFAEQIPCLTKPFARYTPLFEHWITQVGLALAGNAGARLADALAAEVSRSTLLRRLRAIPLPPPESVRVLGVDDFAFRKGITYGTVLVDVETSTVLDLLAERTSDVLSDWLVARPGSQIVCRDRDSAYTRAISASLPHAIQVADRWHMLQNLSHAVEKTCHRHRGCLHKHAWDDVDAPLPLSLLPGQSPPPALPQTPLMQRVATRHAEIHRLRQATWTLSAIARRLGLDRKTVRRYLTDDLDTLIASARDRRPSQLDPYRPYLHQRFAAGTTNAAQLHREISDHGYTGNVQAVRLYVRALRNRTAPAEPPRPVPSPRTITSWIMRPRTSLTRDEQDQLDRVRIACPDISAACDLARAFTAMARDRRGQVLGQWIRQAELDGPDAIRGFAGFLRQDHAAVLAGLTMTYSSGIVEGHINRIKMLKRQMYGRAKLDLLRIRVVLG